MAKTVSGGHVTFEGKGFLVKKMNITFFMENKVLNIFSSNNFFNESNIFGENGEK